MKLEYEELKTEVIEYFNKNKIFALATSSQNRVTARMMSFVNVGTNLYFQTDKNFIKIRQIEENENVALCIGNIQVEGKAKIGKHPFDEVNTEFLKLYKEYHHGSFEAYSGLKDNVVVEIKPILIKFWKYIDNKPYIDTIDFENKYAERIEYSLDNKI